MKNFLFHMISQANGTKWMYNDTIMNLIKYTEHITNSICPVEKKVMVEEFKKVYGELIEERLNGKSFDSSFGNDMKTTVTEKINEQKILDGKIK